MERFNPETKVPGYRNEQVKERKAGPAASAAAATPPPGWFPPIVAMRRVELTMARVESWRAMSRARLRREERRIYVWL